MHMECGYVNSWSSNQQKIVFERSGSLSVALLGQTPTLQVKIMETGGNPHTITVTNNFPIQKWVYIVVSVDHTLIDTYLDGKLVKSHQVFTLGGPAGAPTIATPEGTLTSGKFDAYIARFNVGLILSIHKLYMMNI